MFKCDQFSVTFNSAPEPEDDEGEGISTDVRGFQVASSDDDYEEDGEIDSMHKRALGGSMPLLNPKKKA